MSNFNALQHPKDFPEHVNAFIEISMDSDPIKYEFDEEASVLFADRFIPTGMRYPCNYGFVPKTIGGDGDPLDIMVFTPYPVIPSCVVLSRPIGVLLTEDESGIDEKILAVPAKKVDYTNAGIESYKELPETLIKRIEHFFEKYKDMETDKWVKVKGWRDALEAFDIIRIASERFIKSSTQG